MLEKKGNKMLVKKGNNYMIYTELIFSKNTHNVVTYRNFKDFKEDGFIDDITTKGLD